MKSRDTFGWSIRAFSATVRSFGPHVVHDAESTDVFNKQQDM